MAYTGRLLSRIASVLAKLETTYGTDCSPATGDAIMCFGDPLPQVEAESAELKAINSIGIPAPHIVGARSAKLTIESVLKGSGAAGTAPDIGPLLQACGFSETVAAGASVTYKADPTGKKSATVYVYRNGLLNKITGAVGAAKFKVDPGKPIGVTFELQGIWNAAADAAIVAPTFDTTNPVAVLAPSLSWDSTTMICRALEFANGAKVQRRGDVNAAGGVAGFLVTELEPSGSITVEEDLVANYSFEAKLLANTNLAASLTVGGTAGNIVALSFPRVRVKSLSRKSDGGVACVDMAFGLYSSTNPYTSDPITITLT